MAERLRMLAMLACAFPSLAAAQIVQTVHGDVAHFGEGFTALTEGRVDFRLLRPAHVVLFWVTPDGRIDLFFPVRSRDKTLRRAGDNAISVSEIPSPIQAPVISGDRLAISGYWVLLACDAPITALDVQRRLAPMSREGGGLAIIDRLAPLLVPEGTLWAQYVAAVVLR